MVKNLIRSLVIAAFVPSLAFANEISLGPYIQSPSTNSATINWQTEDPSPSIIETSSDEINFFTHEDNVLKTRHSLTLKNLKPGTKYSYSIFTKKKNKLATLDNQEGEDRFKFKTFEIDPKQTTVWVIGDPGVLGDHKFRKSLQKSQMKVKEAFFSTVDKKDLNNLDFIITLGDNAYANGSFEEYKKGFFEPYADIISNYGVFSAFGNHDGGINRRNMTYAARSYPEPRGVYYDLFNLPGKEAFYSFDHGDAHFIFLDTFDSLWEDFNGTNFEKVWTTQSTSSNKMINWLKADLKKNSKTWTIVSFHHPPFGQTEYTDEKTQDLWKAWTNAYIVPILDQHKVDLALMGHIHNYQRSYPVTIERNDIDRTALKPKVSMRKDREHFVKKYIKLLDELKLPRYTPKLTNKSASNYTKKDDSIYIILGSSGAAFKDLPSSPDANFHTRVKEAGSGLLKITKDELEFNFIGESGNTIDKFVIGK